MRSENPMTSDTQSEGTAANVARIPAKAGMTTEEAILHLRAQPDQMETLRNIYLDGNLADAIERFWSSEEYRAVERLMKPRGRTVVDLGAGVGIASYAFAKSGAARVYAIEPDASVEIGRGAIAKIANGFPITILDAFAESIPLEDASADIVYCRQMLHHSRDLRRCLKECSRVLKPKGVLLACREHVIRDENELQIFLRNHIVHNLAGGENAYRLEDYKNAIAEAGLRLDRVIGPLGSMINAFPYFRKNSELRECIRAPLRQRLGIAGALVSYVPGVTGMVRRILEEPSPGRRWADPGRIYTFLAHKARTK